MTADLARWSMSALALVLGGAAVAEPLRASQYGTSTPALRPGAEETWRLRDEELQEYREIMRGPRGIWTPDIDPVMALGIHVEDPARKRELARRFVRMRHQRLQAELEFQRLVNEEMDAFYVAASAPTGNARAAANSAARSEELFLFASLPCTSRCDRLLGQATKRAHDTGAKLHIYVRDAGDDDAIRHWAFSRNIDRRQVFEREITLNHDRGEWIALSKRHRLEGGTPRLLVHRDDKWHAFEQ